MDFSESEVVALMAIAVLLNGVGLLAWRRGLLGHWYPIAIGLSMLALLADPMSLPGVASAGAIAAMLLGGFGLVVSVRHRKGGTVGRLRASDPGRGSTRGPSTLMARRVFG